MAQQCGTRKAKKNTAAQKPQIMSVWWRVGPVDAPGFGTAIGGLSLAIIAKLLQDILEHCARLGSYGRAPFPRTKGESTLTSKESGTNLPSSILITGK